MLRSTTELIRYEVEAIDGSIGCVSDLYFDDGAWAIRYIAVDCCGILCTDNFLIKPQNVRELKFPEEVLVLGLTKSQTESGVAGGAASPAPASGEEVLPGKTPPPESGGDLLRSVKSISSCSVLASDEPIGNVHGLLVETATWMVRYVIVDTGNWLPGKLVLLAPQAIQRIDWDQETITAGVTSDAVRNSPAYDIDAEISREYEAFLHDYYDWPPYW